MRKNPETIYKFNAQLLKERGLLRTINADLLAALEAHVQHIAVHDRACCRELEALGRAAIAPAEEETG